MINNLHFTPKTLITLCGSQKSLTGSYPKLIKSSHRLNKFFVLSINIIKETDVLNDLKSY